MKYLSTMVLVIAGCISLTAIADDHGDKPKALPMALWSTYEIPVGAKPSEIEASLIEYIKAEEARGFNNCSLYKHEFGSPRAFYTSCTFDDIDHFARIMDGSPPPPTPDEPQLFGGHSDHLVMTTQLKMTTAAQYVLIAATTFAPQLSNAEMQEKAEEFTALMTRLLVTATGMSMRGGQSWPFMHPAASINTRTLRRALTAS